jgi:hypothetical protein
MKNQILVGVVLMALLLVSGTLSVSAQSTEDLMTLQIPFDFQLGESLLPAGEYTFKRIPHLPEVLIIQGADRNPILALGRLGEVAAVPARSAVTFNEYGGKRFLKQVKLVRLGVQYSLVLSKAEHDLAQTNAARLTRTLLIDGSARSHSRKRNVS